MYSSLRGEVTIGTWELRFNLLDYQLDSCQEVLKLVCSVISRYSTPLTLHYFEDPPQFFPATFLKELF